MNSMNAMTRRSLLVTAARQFAILAGAAVVPAIPALAADTTVKIENFAFSPQRISVKVGTAVTWDNADDIPHNIVSSAKIFRSNVLDTGGTFSFTFTTPGVFEYFCSLHPHMTGTIVVEGSTSGDIAP
jgi:plastocyanin